MDTYFLSSMKIGKLLSELELYVTDIKLIKCETDALQ